MRRVSLLPGLVLVACSGATPVEPAPVAEAPPARLTGQMADAELRGFQGCEADTDCVFANDGCCDCANGGRETAIARTKEAEFRARFDCANRPCTMRARVPECGCGTVACVEGACAYRNEGPGCS